MPRPANAKSSPGDVDGERALAVDRALADDRARERRRDHRRDDRGHDRVEHDHAGHDLEHEQHRGERRVVGGREAGGRAGRDQEPRAAPASCAAARRPTRPRRRRTGSAGPRGRASRPTRSRATPPRDLSKVTRIDRCTSPEHDRLHHVGRPRRRRARAGPAARARPRGGRRAPGRRPAPTRGAPRMAVTTSLAPAASRIAKPRASLKPTANAAASAATKSTAKPKRQRSVQPGEPEVTRALYHRAGGGRMARARTTAVLWISIALALAGCRHARRRCGSAPAATTRRSPRTGPASTSTSPGSSPPSRGASSCSCRSSGPSSRRRSSAATSTWR